MEETDEVPVQQERLVLLVENPRRCPKGSMPSHPLEGPGQGQEGAVPMAPKFRNQAGTESLSDPLGGLSRHYPTLGGLSTPNCKLVDLRKKVSVLVFQFPVHS